MNEDIFMNLITVLAVVFLIGLGLKKFLKKQLLPISLSELSPSNRYSVKELLTFLINNKEMRIRLLITIGILIIVRLCAFIPHPGVDSRVLAMFFERVAGKPSPFLSTLPDRVSVFSLGIMPFLSSCILIQILSVFIPALKKAASGGEGGRAQIARYSYGLTVALSLLQSYFMSLWLDNPAHFMGANILTIHGLSLKLITMATLTGGVLLLLFLADLINKYGIGNGIAMIFISGSLMHVLFRAYQCYYMYQEGHLGIVTILIILAIWAGALYLAFFFTRREKKIEVIEATTKREFTIPLRATWTGDVPIGFAESIYLFPFTLASIAATTSVQSVALDIMTNFWIKTIVMVVLIILFTYCYAVVIFRPKNIEDLLTKYNYSLKSADKEIVQCLNGGLYKMLMIGALLLVIMPNVPEIAGYLLQIKESIVIVMRGSLILICAGVFFDLLSQIEFFYEKSKLSGKGLAVAYIAPDEIEARIKSEYLKSKSIDALVEPLRFTWGMPIKTAVDKYRIYTAADKVKDARMLIE